MMVILEEQTANAEDDSPVAANNPADIYATRLSA